MKKAMGVMAPVGRARLAALDASIARGAADADADRAKLAAEVFDRLEAKYRALALARNG